MSKNYSADTNMGVLLDDPSAKEILAKHIPRLNNAGPMIKMARGMTLKTIAGFPQADIPAEKLQAIVSELSKL